MSLSDPAVSSRPRSTWSVAGRSASQYSTPRFTSPTFRPSSYYIVATNYQLPYCINDGNDIIRANVQGIKKKKRKIHIERETYPGRRYSFAVTASAAKIFFVRGDDIRCTPTYLSTDLHTRARAYMYTLIFM